MLDDLIKEVQRFDPSTRVMFEPVAADDLAMLESRLGRPLPDDFRQFLRLTNGLMFFSETFYGIHPEKSSLDVYSNFLWESKESGNPIWDYLVPVSPDGGGNHYCLDLNSISANGKDCNVVFWQHDYEYSDQDPPDLEATSFESFLEKMLNELFAEFNYDGSDR